MYQQCIIRNMNSQKMRRSLYLTVRASEDTIEMLDAIKRARQKLFKTKAGHKKVSQADVIEALVSEAYKRLK